MWITFLSVILSRFCFARWEENEKNEWKNKILTGRFYVIHIRVDFQ